MTDRDIDGTILNPGPRRLVAGHTFQVLWRRAILPSSTWSKIISFAMGMVSCIIPESDHSRFVFSLLDHHFSTHGVMSTFLNEPGAVPATDNIMLFFFFLLWKNMGELHLGLVSESFFLYHTTLVNRQSLLSGEQPRLCTACTTAGAHWLSNHLLTQLHEENHI